MKRIDAHQHFWQFNPVRDTWINGQMKLIQKDFLPDDLYPVLQENGFDGCVAVQASQSLVETEFLISLAKKHKFIKGVVGWIDLQADDIISTLSEYSQVEIVKGFRQILQSETQRDIMLQGNFKRGIAALQQYGFTYDLLILPDQLKFSKELVAAFPHEKFVIDHIAKPDIQCKDMVGWKKDIEQIAEYENVYCKISGMVTEADWKNWKTEDFQPYIDVVVNAFGTKRIMYGSDWPVCQVAASYEEMLGIVKTYFSTFSKDEQQNFFGLNAIDFYNLQIK